MVEAKKTPNQEPGVTLLTDQQWSVIDGDVCKVHDFVPWGSVKNGQVFAISKTTPYASIDFKCSKIPQVVKGFVSHKEDFVNLWRVFKERGVKPDEEIIVIWSKKNYKKGAGLFKSFLPKLKIMICKKGAFEIMVNPKSRPDLQGKAWYLAIKPIEEFKPEVIE
jgi:hypothetical protein